jgi:hypothetical protein
MPFLVFNFDLILVTNKKRLKKLKHYSMSKLVIMFLPQNKKDSMFNLLFWLVFAITVFLGVESAINLLS